MEIPPDKLEGGSSGTITHWVNQPGYVGNTLKNVEGRLMMVNKKGMVTNYIDMRYPHYCKVRISR